MDDDSPITEVAPDFLLARPGALVEVVMDTHRVIGELRSAGNVRRLVDILNSIESGFVVVHSGELDDPFNPGEKPRAFDVMQLHRDAILFAAPRGSSPRQGSSLEAVAKVAVPGTIVLPGYEITGNVFLLPDADPAGVPLLSNRHFIPLTDVTVVASHARSRQWREPLLILNLARALVYAPARQAHSLTPVILSELS